MITFLYPNSTRGPRMERNLTSDAIVLTHRRWGDLHRLVTLLSPDLGIFEAVAYGARKGKLAGGIEIGTLGTVYLYHNRTRGDYTLVDVDPEHTVERIRDDLPRLYTAQTMTEMALRMHGGDFEQLYRELGSALILLESGEADPRLILIQYIWRFISIMGLESELASCPICSNEYGEQEILSFNTGLHTPCCARCGDVDSTSYELALGPGARRYLTLTRTLDVQEAVSVQLSETAAIRLGRYMIRYVTNILGGPLKTLSGGVLMEVLM
ncbi:MAG TPA: DNA repair protein RecO [Sphaerochaetaceae bacterium]|nr:DNA repair protein RecO [Sphaerochaetaceae bacterium]